MRHLGLWQCLAGCTLLFAASSHAAVYEINSTSDPEVSVEVVDDTPNDMEWDKSTRWDVTTSLADGLCSLREAVYASNYRIEVDGCAAGTGVDTIKLKEKKTYALTHGLLPLGIGQSIVIDIDEDDDTQFTVDINDIPSQLAITLQLDAFEKAEGKVRPLISGGNASRIFGIYERGALSLANVELVDGLAGPDADMEILDSNGGLIHAAGPIILNSNVRLAGGEAENGGAVFMTKGSGMAFRTGGSFENNVASQEGAVIATSDTFDGNIIGADFYMAANEAGAGPDGAAIHLDGGNPGDPGDPGDPGADPPVPAVPAVPAVRIGMELANGTITGNTGGGINIVSENYASVLVNLTIAFNDGVALTMAETVFNDPADAETTDLILHSVFVGNSCSGVACACAGAALDGTAVNADAAARTLFTITDDANCPLPAEQTEGTPVTSNPNAAGLDILMGDGRLPCATIGAAGCTPMTAEDIDGPYPGFLPNPLPAAVDPSSPDFIALDAASLFDRGNPENVATDPCESTDNRGKPRGGPGGRCDVGAIEFLRAQAQPEEIDMISGRSVLGDVVANDLNDTVIDCRRLNDIVDVENSCMGDQACIDQGVLDRCLIVVEGPDLGTAVPVIDANGYPKIRYTPASTYHGVDQIRYQVDKDAFDGGTDLGQNQDEIANFFAEPASGLTEKKSIFDDGGGSQGVGLLVLMALLGWVRRYGKGLKGAAFLLAFLATGQALAVDITVNSLADDVPPIKNDGKCTLREALLNAAEAGSPDCAYGGDATDTILLPEGDIQLTTTLVVEGGGVEIVGTGAREDASDEDVTLTRILGDGSFRLFEVQPPNTSSGYPSVRFQYLTLEDGYVSGTGSDGTGSGAVIITGGTVIFDRVRVLNNQAESSGGVVFIRANAGNQKLVTFNRSFVSGNTAGVSGGVMSTTAQNGEVFKVAMIDSTFQGNSAVIEGGVLDANIRAGEIQIANSTFADNSAAKGSALDFSGLTINANIMNATFMNNTGGSGLDLGDAATQTRMSNSAYFDSGDACSTGGTILVESEYNAYSGLACVATNASATDQFSTGSASLDSVLSSTEGEGTSDDYVPPYVAVVSPDTDGVLVNMGNEAELVSGTGTPLACRAKDLRGVDRTSGGRCDIGAFEYQQITAEDDEATNQNTPASQVPVNILGNDLPSDGAEFVLLDDNDPATFATGHFTFEHAVLVEDSDPEEYASTGDVYLQDISVDGDPTLFVLKSDPVDMSSPNYPSISDPSLEGASLQFVWLYYNEDRRGYDLKCGDPIPSHIIADNPNLFEPGDVADECVLLFRPQENNEDFVARMCASDSDDPLKIAFRYTFKDSEGVEVLPDDAGTVVMTIRDKPPTLKGKSVLNKPGEKVVFKLELSDPNEPDAIVDWTSGRYDVSIASEPNFAKKDQNGEVLGVGIVIDDDNAGTVTYVPDSNFNTFKDTFTLRVEDTLCDTTSGQIRFTVRYENKETSAAAGSFGWMVLGGLLMLLRRRFAA